MKITKSLSSAAYRAIERESFSEDKDTQSAADQSMTEYFDKTISVEKLKYYANREKEYCQLKV